MIKTVELCTRIEGHGEISVYTRDDQLLQAEFKLPIYRGFETMLKGKKILDVPRIVSRICGLCHASQTIVSCKVIENMYNIKPTQQAIVLRRILMTAEMLKSHTTHFFFHSFPDLLKLFKISNKILDLNQLIAYDRILTKNIFELIKIGDDINKMLGSRSVHLVNVLPGGIIFKPSTHFSRNFQTLLSKGIGALKEILEFFIKQFSNLDPPASFSIPKVKNLALNNKKIYDRYEGIMTIKESRTKYEDFPIENFLEHFERDVGLRGINTLSESKTAILVGPIARRNIVENYGVQECNSYLDLFGKEWKKNLLFSNYLRLIEMYSEMKAINQYLETTRLESNLPLPDFRSIKNFEGISAVEAPRGSLLHYYKINERNVVEDAKFFIATEFNLPIINKMITKYARSIYETKDISEVKKEIQPMIRAFDPCISCATH
ncbi:MAG: nickel-dependent hydrogenase large subunit [Candidatus Lokiarchaeota archaeon]|nr:nickel-dependent hydrogenase large subunit [Candidatus Lokiarchaeota archaeon]